MLLKYITIINMLLVLVIWLLVIVIVIAHRMILDAEALELIEPGLLVHVGHVLPV